MAYTNEQLNEIHRMAHLMAREKHSKDPRIREVANRCRAIERLCESIRKGARDSALANAFHTLDNMMIKTVVIYTMEQNQGPPPGWT